jgi:hypothetical protein
MKFTIPKKEPMPPHLNLNEYADFFVESIKHHDMTKVAKQKSIEKKFSKPFCIPPESTENYR